MSAAERKPHRQKTAVLHTQLVFDGSCGFCTRAALLLKRLDRYARIELLPAQRSGVLTRLNLSSAQAASSVWVVTDTGLLSGAAAVNCVLDIVFDTKAFTRFYRLPGCSQIQEFIYKQIAANRYRFPGVTPWCAQNPSDCITTDDNHGCAVKLPK